MRPWVLRGSKDEIAKSVAKLEGDIREAIVFVNEPVREAGPGSTNTPAADIFAEMEPFIVRHGEAADTRESIYTKLEDE